VVTGPLSVLGAFASFVAGLVATEGTGVAPREAGRLAVGFVRVSMGGAGSIVRLANVRSFTPNCRTTDQGSRLVNQAPPDGEIRSEPQLFAVVPPHHASHLAGLRLPEPQFPTKTPAGRRPNPPAPVGAPVGRPIGSGGDQVGTSSVEGLRWALCPDDGCLHLLKPAGVDLAATSGHAEALCGQRVPAQGLTINGAPSGALCMACVIGAAS